MSDGAAVAEVSGGGEAPVEGGAPAEGGEAPASGGGDVDFGEVVEALDGSTPRDGLPDSMRPSEGEAGGEPAPEPKEPAPAMRKLKVDGVEIEVSEDELVALAQKGRASDERFRQVAAERKRLEKTQGEINQLMDALQRDPLGSLIAIMGKEKFWGQVKERYDYSMLPEAERQRIEAERERDRKAKAWEEEQERQRAAQEQAVHQQRVQQASSVIVPRMQEALRAAGTTVDAETMYETAALARALSIERGVPFDRMPWERIAARVAETVGQRRSSMFQLEEGGDPEVVLARIEAMGGLEVVKRALVERHKKKRAKAQNGRKRARVRVDAPVQSTEDFFASLRNE